MVFAIVAAAVVVFYLLISLVISRFMLRLTTKPQRHTFESAKEQEMRVYKGLSFERYEEWEKTRFSVDSNGAEICGEYIRNANSNKVAIICHGFTMNRMASVKYAYIFYNLGYNLVLYDARYFGESGGEYSTLGMNESDDLVKIVDFCLDTFGKDCSIAVHGESMGAATALLSLAKDSMQDKISLVVCDCPFADTMKLFRDMMRKLFHFPSFPVVDFALVSARKMGYNFDKVKPIEALEGNRVPVCFIHGNSDRLINCSHSKDMFAKAVSNNEHSELHLVDGADHAMSIAMGFDGYAEIVSKFVSKNEGYIKEANNESI